MNENKLKHIELIQGVITRMANNSFLLKGWTVSIIIAIFAFSKEQLLQCPQIFVVILPIIIFWILDGYFLYQERLYRALYKEVSKMKPEDIDFSMNAYGFHGKNKCTKIEAIFSETLIPFYTSLLTVSFILIYSYV